MRLIHKKLIVFVFVALILFPLIGVGVGGKAYADTALSGYSGVLDDLQKDDSFNPDEYPAIDDDYSLQVIQIAESTSGELFVYVYQPAANVKPLTATQINMSLTDDFAPYDYEDNVDNSGSNAGGSSDGDGGGIDGSSGGGGGGGGSHGCSLALSETSDNQPSTYLYDLTLLNRNGVFAKYKVTDFTINGSMVRYYNITSIFREFNKDLGDIETGNDNVKNSVYFKVGKLYAALTVDGAVKYACKNVDVVEIKNPYVDYLSYYDGVTWASLFGFAPDNYTDVHYIAFSTDKKIDNLKEADVTYTTQSYHFTGKNNEGYTYGDKSDPQYITLTGEMNGSTSDSGNWFAGTYSWKSIQRTSDFIQSTGMDSGNYAYDNIKDTEFVLVFLTTPYSEKEEYSLMQGHYKVKDGTKVSNVSILRLMFETDGITYNLGALMDQQEGDDTSGNAVKQLGFWAYIWRCIVRLFNGTATLIEQIVAVVAIFIVVLALPILLIVLSLVFPAFGAVMKTIFNGVWTGIKYLFIALWYVIISPVRLIIWIVHKARGD